MRVLVVGRSVLPFGPHVGAAELAGYYLAVSLAEILNSDQVSPWEYRFRVAADAPYSLVVSNTYDPLWRVMVEGRELSPQPACYLASAYTVDRVGEYDLTLEFVGQRYQWFAFALSGLAYGATIVALAVCLLRG